MKKERKKSVKTPGSGPGGKSVRVLVLDDEQTIRDLVSLSLMKAGCDVVTAADGREGLQRLLDQNFDVAVVDLKMRGMDGFAFLSEALRMRPWLGVVIMTGYLDDATRCQADKLGVRHILAKPLHLEELAQKVFEEAHRHREDDTAGEFSLERFRSELDILRTVTQSALEEESLYRALYEMSSGFVELVNASAVAVLTLDEDEPRLMLFMHEPVAASFLDDIEDHLRRRYYALSGEPLPDDLRMKIEGVACDAAGHDRALTCTTVPIMLENEVLGLLGLASPAEAAYTDADTTFLYHAANHLSSVLLAFQRMRELAIRDGLTDLFNRRHMLEQIGYICKMCKRYSLPVGVAIIDVDHFKEVNDQYGHLVGDEVLIELAGLLRRSATRESDIIGRYGGDELIVILPDAGLEGAWNFGERLLAAVRGHEFCPSTHRLHLTVSIGVTSVPGEDAAKMPCSELVAHADQALYTAKRKGRNCMCAWSGGVDAVLEGTVLADRRNQPAFDAPVGDHPDAKREAVISALCAVMYAGRDEVEVHSEKAREMARILGRRMGISDRELQDVADGAVLHDIGKIGIPRHLLTKTSELSEEDWVVLRRHPEFGYEILRRFECLGTVPSIVHCHHEWFNGEGYPRGLEGDDIPLAARIVAVLDAYEAMRGGRVYREPRSREECVAAIKEASGTQFDPAVVEAFLNSLDAIERVGDWERSAARDLKASGITG